jgi:glycosyltransferase involved in cell wall biosynthesis
VSTHPKVNLVASGAIGDAKATPMRALFINDTSRNGGPGRTILDILRHLDPDRVHRTVLLPREGIVSQSLTEAGVADELMIVPGFIENLYEPISRTIAREDLNAPIHLKAVRAVVNIFRAASALLKIVRRVRRGHFDVVFCNGTMANFIGGFIAALTPVPVVWHVIYSSVPKILQPMHLYFARRATVRAILCVSRAVMGQFRNCDSKVRLIPDALDIDEFRNGAVTPILRKEFGFGDATTIFDRLGNDPTACRFVVVGDTPEDLKPDHLAECRALVRALGLEEKVYFPGFRADVRPYLADFDVAIVPSVYEDPLPRSVMESMAMSKPVVAFDVGGIAEMVTAGHDGILVRGRPPDIEGLAEACLLYHRDEKRRRDDGAAGRRKAETEFNARVHSQRIESVLWTAAGLPGRGQ